MCELFPGLRCNDHEEIQSRSVEPDPGQVQLRIYASRGQTVLSESPNHKTAHQGNQIFQLNERAFAAALKEATLQTGAVLSVADLEGRARELFAADRERRRSKARGVYVRHAQATGVLGDWARYALRKECAEDIGKARGRAKALDALLERYRVDAGCLELIDAAR